MKHMRAVCTVVDVWRLTESIDACNTKALTNIPFQLGLVFVADEPNDVAVGVAAAAAAAADDVILGSLELAFVR